MSANCEYCNQPFSRLSGVKRHQGKAPGRPLSCPVMDPNLQKKMISDYPHLLSEYNGSEDPKKIIAGTNKRLDWKCSICNHTWTATGNKREFAGRGCPSCANQAINNFDGRNSMENTHPELAKEYQGDASKIIAGTHKKLDWKCSVCDHEWKAQCKSRAYGKHGCPACSGRLHSDGRNSMANTHPKLGIEYQGDATKIIAGTSKKVSWKCSDCENEWKANGENRVQRGGGCPDCAETGFNILKPANVYQIIFYTRDHGTFYKCGITNREVHPRFVKIVKSYRDNYDDAIDIKVIKQIYFESGSEAWDFEKKLKASDCKLEELFSEKFDGFTETYSSGILDLWDQLAAEVEDRRV